MTRLQGNIKFDLSLCAVLLWLLGWLSLLLCFVL